jgi:hypothetical protein
MRSRGSLNMPFRLICPRVGCRHRCGGRYRIGAIDSGVVQDGRLWEVRNLSVDSDRWSGPLDNWRSAVFDAGRTEANNPDDNASRENYG